MRMSCQSLVPSSNVAEETGPLAAVSQNGAKYSQGNVATHLRCDRIFNNDLVISSLCNCVPYVLGG